MLQILTVQMDCFVQKVSASAALVLQAPRVSTLAQSARTIGSRASLAENAENQLAIGLAVPAGANKEGREDQPRRDRS